MKVQVINQLGNYDKEMAIIVDVMGQYSQLVTMAHEMAPIEVAFAPGLLVAPDGFCPLNALTTMDVPGAEGYHDLDPQGRPYGNVALSCIPGGELLNDKSGTGQSLAAVLMHELAEMMRNAYANWLAQLRIKDPSSTKVYGLAALELCDWVQNFAFNLNAKDGTAVNCSDFVFLNFFNPSAPAGTQLSYMGTVTTPGEVAAGCYGIVSDETSETQVFAELAHTEAPLVRHAPTRIFHATEKPPAWREDMFSQSKHSRFNKIVRKAA